MASGFTINKIQLHNFRNYENEHRSFDGGLNKIVGPNATGKTNIIEALCLLTQINSFRNSTTSNLIKNGCDECKISAEIYDIDTDTINNISLEIKNNKKKYIFNEKSKSISECKGKYPSVVFCPDDLEIVKAGNSVRRNFFDNIGCQISKDYYQVYKDYHKAITNKNAALKDGADKTLLISINDILIITGAQLMYYRFSLVEKLLPEAAAFYKEISNDGVDLSINYCPSYKDEPIKSLNRDEARDWLSKALEETLLEEINRKTSLIGPHKDKISIDLANADAQYFASQGQQRSIVLALKLAELKIIEEQLNKHPILLLDDVLSELDDFRKEKLLSSVVNLPQTFITST